MDQTKVSLRSVARALSDVVAPAVDPHNAQAQEQLRLAIDCIEFVAGRVDHLYDRERFELRQHLAMGSALLAVAGASASSEFQSLSGAVQAGQDALNRAPALPHLREAGAALAESVCAFICAASALPEPVRAQVERTVIHASKPRIEFERSWYAPLGFNPDEADVKPLAEVLQL